MSCSAAVPPVPLRSASLWERGSYRAARGVWGSPRLGPATEIKSADSALSRRFICGRAAAPRPVRCLRLPS